MNNNQIIDAVITWVDGDDVVHFNKRTAMSAGLSHSVGHNSSSTRFSQRGEISLCVRSILQYAPWIRNIYIVTDAQIPLIYHQLQATKYANKLKIIDHSVIFSGYAEHLPTFNSLAIESMLWRIPDLSENFIYFNDDCFLLRAMAPEDFFINEKIVIRGSWKTQSHHRWLYKLKKYWSSVNRHLTVKKNDHRLIQERSASLAGYEVKVYHLPHIPFALKKTVLQQYFERYPAELYGNIAHAFRHPDAQIWPVSLMIHLAIKQKRVEYCHNFQAIMVNGETHAPRKFLARLHAAQRKKNAAFLCVQSLDQASNQVQEQCHAWLNQQIMSVKELA